MYITNILIAIPQNTMLLDRKIEMHGTLLLFCLVFFFLMWGSTLLVGSEDACLIEICKM